MGKDNGVGIKVELSKDKNTGKLSVGVRFYSKAPNVSAEKDSFLWFPTDEEIDFLKEAFELFSKERKINGKKISAESSEDIPNIKIEVKEDKNIEKFNNDYNCKNKEMIKKGDEIIEEMIKKYIQKEKDTEESDVHLIIEKVVNQKKRNRLKKL